MILEERGVGIGRRRGKYRALETMRQCIINDTEDKGIADNSYCLTQ